MEKARITNIYEEIIALCRGSRYEKDIILVEG